MPSAEAAPSHSFPEPTDAKRTARAEAKRRRAEAHAAEPAAAVSVRDHALAAIPVPVDAAVSGYWPVGEELDPRPLMLALKDRGARLALPVAEARGRPLRFRAWAPGDALEPGALRIPEPLASAPEVVPDVVLVPMLAFDRRGFRLGYGAGFYDRTLERVRAAKPVLAIGLAYAGQEMGQVPIGPHDEPLDWVVTELGATRLTEDR